jgi:flavin-dependent thymidylate synthase
MKANLIDYNGKESSDPWYAARILVYTKNTRLEQGEETRAKVAEMSPEDIQKELEYIAGTIRSSWEFIDYTFEIQGVTRAFTHQFVRTRTASYAQQAQRVVDMGSFKTLVPDSVSAADGGERWTDLMAHISDVYQYYSSEGVPNQDCRGVLPTNVFTNIIAKINLRTLADLIGKRENLRTQGEYADVARAMKAEVYAVHPWTKPFLDPERTRTPALDALLKGALGDRAPIEAPEINAALKELDTLKGTWG